MLHERTGDRQALTLTAREVRTALGYRRIESLRLVEYKVALGNL